MGTTMLDWEAYFERLVRLKVDFELAGKALVDWSRDPEMIRKHAEEGFADMRALISKGLEEESIEENSHWISKPESFASYVESAQQEAISGVTAFKTRLS